MIYRATATDLDTVTNIDSNGNVIVGAAIAGSALNFSLAAAGAGNNNSLFTMSNNGEVTLNEATGAGSYVLELLASDGANTTTKDATVTVDGGANPIINLTDTFASSMNVSQSTMYGSYSATNVLDNNINTFNHTQFGTNESLTLDFGPGDTAFDVTEI